MNALEYLRELKRQGVQLTPLQSVVWDAIWTQDPNAEDAAEELANMQAVIVAARGLLDYRRRAGPLNFQLEKADDYLHMIGIALAALKEQKQS